MPAIKRPLRSCRASTGQVLHHIPVGLESRVDANTGGRHDLNCQRRPLSELHSLCPALRRAGALILVVVNYHLLHGYTTMALVEELLKTGG